ncbi:MAG TPA: AAA family ATPase [Solirubrobacteraceae bacterium]|nr:AAA family ATPase [Solirubrobacteraceae bacterium]
MRLLGREAQTQALDRLITEARAATSGVLVLVGGTGVGKTALLEYAESGGTGMTILRAAGVHPEVDIAYAGLHQLLLALHDRIDEIAEPHAEALRSAFGLTASAPRDRFFVGMAALALLSHAAMEEPVLCLIDDVHQLDRASIDALGFAARRLVADRVAMIFATHVAERVTTLQGLAHMRLSGLDADAAHELLASVAGGAVDQSVADRIVTDTQGNPLAIIELVPELTRDQLEGLAPLPELLPLGRRLDERAVARLRALPSEAQTLLLLAAADPSGDPGLFWRAAWKQYGLTPSSIDLSTVERYLSCSPRIRFNHPLMRAGAYYGASGPERRRAHRALAAATDPVRDADCRAWHLAAAAVAPDEAIARELERSADRARRRGGWASRANFLERAAELSPDESRRAERLLECAHARLLADQPVAARTALRQAASALSDPISCSRATRLEGLIDFTLGRPGDAAATLLIAARMIAAYDAREARDTLLEAFDAAHLAGTFAADGVARVLEVHRALPPDPVPTVVDVLLDGFAALLESGDEAGVAIIRPILDAVTADQPMTDEELSWLPIAWIAAPEFYDDRAWQVLTARWATAARVRGAVNALPIGLGRIPHFDVVTGRFAAAERMTAEARDLAAATPSAGHPGGYATPEMSALAWRGREPEARSAAATLIAEFTRLGRGVGIRVVQLALAVLELGLGNYRDALRAAQKARGDDRLLHLNVDPELVEAAVRCGELEVAQAALERLSIRVQATGTDWGLGLLLRSQALLADRERAEELYQGAIDHLTRTLVVPQLGRAHLLYGEWLRRQRRRRDAREQLRAALDLLSDIGAEAFAERARAELLATGEQVRRRAADTLDQLTPQEEQIARLASAGASNMDIATQLFISVPTVAYHLQKAFRKLEITNRASLARALSGRDIQWTGASDPNGVDWQANGTARSTGTSELGRPSARSPG